SPPPRPPRSQWKAIDSSPNRKTQGPTPMITARLAVASDGSGRLLQRIKSGGTPVIMASPSRRRGSHGRIKHESIGVPSVETRSSWIIATVLLVILALSFGAPWITIVALKVIAAESDGLRAVPSLATSLAWLGFGSGGIAMGYVAERIGVRSTVI